MSPRRIVTLFLLAFSLIGFSASARGDGNTAAAPAGTTEGTPQSPTDEGKGKLDVAGEMFGHVGDSHEWHILTYHEHPVAVALPVIIYDASKGLKIFSAAHFNYEEGALQADGKTKIFRGDNGYHLEKNIKEKVVADDGAKVYDFSITKNVLSMFLSLIILLPLMLGAAKKYSRNGVMKAPTGFQNALEPVITFIRDEVARPNLGYKYTRYMPLLLTVFFFIWVNNLLGLLPFGFNFTGNIAVTLCLAAIAFVVMLANANKHFWSHLLNPPGVPLGIKFLLVPIEIISLFVKPIALTIRLFANILAGHIVILSVVFMIFIFGSLSHVAGWGFAPVSMAFTVFMFFLELLVGAIQAFIFTNLTAVFIGQATEEVHHHEAGDHSMDHSVSADEIIA